ncbi:hypothetical protein G9444_6644 (plasmid) [Rhodococcus erythropolis]|uniref:Uncharacterized protein n=1 Tax=Rhodococcus erythropolis TaxID=1833 RepID=A0A6G9D3S8_RHOER|nr:hypothetical protein G9444_6644 [Rhodococcus erythropolis]
MTDSIVAFAPVSSMSAITKTEVPLGLIQT